MAGLEKDVKEDKLRFTQTMFARLGPVLAPCTAAEGPCQHVHAEGMQRLGARSASTERN